MKIDEINDKRLKLIDESSYGARGASSLGDCGAVCRRDTRCQCIICIIFDFSHIHLLRVSGGAAIIMCRPTIEMARFSMSAFQSESFLSIFFFHSFLRGPASCIDRNQQKTMLNERAKILFFCCFFPQNKLPTLRFLCDFNLNMNNCMIFFLRVFLSRPLPDTAAVSPVAINADHFFFAFHFVRLVIYITMDEDGAKEQDERETMMNARYHLRSHTSQIGNRIASLRVGRNGRDYQSSCWL